MFAYQEKTLYCEQVALAEIARKAGTPCYVYSATSILDAYRAYDYAFGEIPHTVCFAVKANSSLGVLSLLAKAGSGFDIVSGGELERVRRADKRAVARTVFSGVGRLIEWSRIVDLMLTTVLGMWHSTHELPALPARWRVCSVSCDSIV